MFFSKTTKGFYEPADVKPGDAVAISRDLYLALLQGQADGSVIDVDDSGAPVLVDAGAA